MEIFTINNDFVKRLAVDISAAALDEEVDSKNRYELEKALRNGEEHDVVAKDLVNLIQSLVTHLKGLDAEKEHVVRILDGKRAVVRDTISWCRDMLKTYCQHYDVKKIETGVFSAVLMPGKESIRIHDELIKELPAEVLNDEDVVTLKPKINKTALKKKYKHYQDFKCVEVVQGEDFIKIS